MGGKARADAISEEELDRIVSKAGKSGEGPCGQTNDGIALSNRAKSFRSPVE
jgi:hypothetical protein